MFQHKKFIKVLFLNLIVINSVVSEQWYDNGNFYQIYLRSFKDSDGDGIGDF